MCAYEILLCVCIHACPSLILVHKQVDGFFMKLGMVLCHWRHTTGILSMISAHTFVHFAYK